MAQLIRKRSYKTKQNHMHDSINSLGYKYWVNGILEKVVSRELYSNPVHDGTYKSIDDVLIYLVNAAKLIKLHYSIAHDKDTIYIN